MTDSTDQRTYEAMNRILPNLLAASELQRISRGVTTAVHCEAARLVGVDPRDIGTVSEVTEGSLIALTDGTELLVVAKSRPDAEGNWGLMDRAAYVPLEAKKKGRGR